MQYLFSFYLVGSTGVMLLSAPLVRAQAPTVTNSALSPLANARAANRTTPLVIPFSQAINPSTAANIRVSSSQYKGQRTSSITVVGNIVTLTPTATRLAPEFKPGETVTVTIPSTVQNTSGSGVVPYVYQFTTAATGGIGQLARYQDVPVGERPSGVAVADVDGDGDLDMLCANFQSNTVSVRFNSGNGFFSGTTEISVGVGPGQVAAADADGDGDLDFYTVNTNSVSLRLNDGTGQFSGTTELLGGGGSIAVGDTDGDGLPNVLTDTAGKLVLGDIDGDGDLDLCSATGPVVKLNNGTGVFTGTIVLDSNTGYIPKSVAAGDIDGDGDLDLVSAASLPHLLDGRVVVWQNEGNGQFRKTAVIPLSGLTNDIALSDMDGDGDLDFLASNFISGPLDIGLNNGSGTFTKAPRGTGLGDIALAVGDLDGDGDLDVLSAYVTGGKVGVQLNNGTTTRTRTSDLAAQLLLYPNPASPTTPVQVELPVEAAIHAVQATIFNPLGQAVGVANLPVRAGVAAGPLPTIGLASGIYHVQLQVGSTVLSKRLVL